MEYEHLLDILGIHGPEEFEYFENFADLVETDEEVSEEALFQLFSETDVDTVAELIGNYFEDMTDVVPDGETDVYTLMENIRMSLTGLLRGARDDEGFMRFAEELARFIRWYAQDSYVECTNLDDPKDHKVLTVRDAFTQERIAHLEKENYKYDFSDALDYALDDYGMRFADMIDAAEEPDYGDDILSKGYVYDDEMGGDDY
ncbi:MAG: hypothetical protein PUC26_06540 [Eubacteriales bacterium]|jgi:hypothetical protein|nr:hypothetical protein [Eubacteriales bacterium]